MHRIALLFALAGPGAACLGGTEPAPLPSGRLAVGVAPLTLAGVSDACYDLRVKTGPLPGGALVWEREDVCSSRFGDGRGSLSYVGTCDATAPFGEVAKNTVELVLDGLWANGAAPTGTPLDDFRNPCPASAPCRLEAECRDNADTPVEFNLTIARQANQGFFDVAVNFEDIFCSAKVDCNRPDGSTIDLLHDPATGQRDATLVAAFACYSGESDTVMHMTDLLIECPDLTYIVAPSAGAGGLISPLGPEDEILFAAAVYEGFEPQAGTGLAYWNAALGIDEAALPASGCTFKVRATASSDSWTTGYIPPRFTSYPVMTAEVPLEVIGGALSCGIHPLDGPDSDVVTSYQPTGPLVGDPFCHELNPANTGELTEELPGCGVTNVFPNAFGGEPIVGFDGLIYRAEVPPNAFETGAGGPVDGLVYMVASNEGFSGNALMGGDPVDPSLIANFDFFDADGNPVQVAPGASVTIYMPIPGGGLFTLGDTVPVYYYDEASSSWVFETNGQIVSIQGTLYLRATVSHFTWYGTTPTRQHCLNVTVLDDQGAPLPNVVVRSTPLPITGSSFFEGLTGPNGRVCLRTRSNSSARVEVLALPPGDTVAPLSQNAGPFANVAVLCGSAACQNLAVPFVVTRAQDCDGDFTSG